MSLEPNNNPTKPMDASAPKEGWSPMPVLLIGVLGLLFFWGLIRLDDRGGGFDKSVYPPYTSVDEVDKAWPLDPIAARRAHGKTLFEKNCSPCHGLNGGGIPAVNAPPLAGSEWVNAEGPNRVIRIVLNGLSGPIQVKGQQFGAGVMVPWRDGLKDDEIADILFYVRGNKDWGNSAGDVEAAQVKAIRDKTVDKGGPWSAADLEKVPVKD